MRALKVHVYDQDSGRTREEKYSRSPVRIGRNPRNDLCLSFGFVSGWHAKVEFNDQGGAFTDLGSTNGSTVGGRKVEAGQAVQIGDGLGVTIGKLEMRFTWEDSDAGYSGSYDRDPQGAVVSRVPRLPTMPIQAVPDLGHDLPRDPYAPATLQHPASGASTGPPPLGGPPSMDGPPSLGGPPPLSGGPPPLSGGPPPLSGGPPPLGGGPPPLSGGPPPLSGGPPSMGGPPSLGGPPPLSGGPPSLGGPPPLSGGPPPMDGPPSLGGPPAMGGPPSLGGPPAMGGPPPLSTPAREGDTSNPPPRRPSGAEATGFVDLGGVHRAIRELRPAYEQYEAARRQFEQSIEIALSKIPVNTRDTAMAFLRREFPEMPGATPFAAPPVADTGAEASSAVTNFAAHLLSTVTPPGDADEQSAFLARVAEILQTTAQAFVEIRNVQARFGEEMGVRTIREYTPLHAAADARNVLDYLLDWRRGGPERNAQLSGVYSDFMLHQVALINGVVEGVQAMMDQFRPAEIERGVGGLSKAAGAWKKYSERYAEEIEERGIAALVFGPEFARAYTEVGAG